MLFPISFLGLAEHIEMPGARYPYGPVDIFGLSKFKNFFFYPWGLENHVWVFMVRSSIFTHLDEHSFSITILNEDGVKYANIELNKTTQGSVENITTLDNGYCDISIGPLDDDWQLVMGRFPLVAVKPEKYTIVATHKNETSQIGQIVFLYDKSEPLQAEEIKALETDPYSATHVRAELGCKSCDFKYKIYTSLDRDNGLESEGYNWQYDLPNTVSCNCGKTNHNLVYFKESMHAILRISDLTSSGELNYTRRYSHSYILNIVNMYSNLLKSEKYENPVQKFLENHAVLLSQFHAQKVFIKPNILGKYEADFAILDTNNRLIFIEIERPSIKLFKKDGHPTADLMHAYGQVHDWLLEFSKNKSAIVESLGIKEAQVLKVSGVVIAGLSSNESREHLERHLLKPLYIDIEFMTLDQLGVSLAQLSRELA